MPQVIITTQAQLDLDRFRIFLHDKNPQAVRRALQVIREHLMLLETAPRIGTPVPEHRAWRELFIPFGATGYVALYLHEPRDDKVYVLAFRHQKEAGW